jgi:serine phosphatase RsbU (regulator of sigma subunit)/pSer/pThr/pTyr-binding forkhead associated (FHA) protein
MRAASVTYFDAGGKCTVALEKSSTSIGRLAGQDIVLNDPAVSRRHAAIAREGDAYMIVDQKSTHGTYLNGVRVDKVVLTPGDVIQLGSLKGVRLQFHTDPADDTEGRLFAGSSTSLLTSFKKLAQETGEAKPAQRGIEQLTWLLEAARQLNESGEIDEILTALLGLTLQLTHLERGFVFLRENGEMRFVQGLRADGTRVDEDATISHTAIRKAIESRSKFTVSDTLADQSASEWSSVMVSKIRSICCIPLRQRVSAQSPSELLGLLYLDSQLQPEFLSDVDHQLLDTIAIEAAALLHNVVLAEAEFKARQAREELAIAAKIHSGLMAVSIPALPYATIQARTIPCLEIGGDFYDVVALDDCVYLTIVDVSGKGVPAAIVAATLQGIIHAQLLARQSLAAIVGLVNRFLCDRAVGKYATLVLVKLSPDGRLEYMNCGHVEPLVVQGADVRRLEVGNLVVGLIAGAQYTPGQDALRPGERLILATDGITEAENHAGDLFGYTGLTTAARDGNIEVILAQVDQFQAASRAEDDCTLLQVRYRAAAD